MMINTDGFWLHSFAEVNIVFVFIVNSYCNNTLYFETMWKKSTKSS